MVAPIEFFFIFLTSIGLNLIPFAGPSNLFIASTAAIALADADPVTLVLVGFLVAMGSSIAKSVHYLITFFVSKRLSEERRRRLDKEAAKVRKWAFALLFAAAASPIPDEPVVIPLGLLKYSPVKFFTAFFFGKLSITVAGAFLGDWTKNTFSGWLSQDALIVISIVLTIVITIVLLKVDVEDLFNRIFRRKKKENEPDENIDEGKS